MGKPNTEERMKNSKLMGTALAFGMVVFAGQAFAGPSCGANTGATATGEPIIVGGIHGNAPPGDWTSSTDSAGAYFD
jgi:branched-chain amino acid transport system substrate-binding protein